MGNCPTCSPEHVSKSLDPLCNGKRVWTTFLFSSFVVLIGGWMIILIYRVFQKLFAKCCRIRFSARTKNVHSLRQELPDGDDAADFHFSWRHEIKEWENNIISGQTKTSKTFNTVILLCSIASLILYCLDTKHNTYMESCTTFNKSISMQADFGLNIVFLVYFILRMAAAQDKRRFWFSLHSLVDIFTIPSSFIALYLNRSWIGFRFLRALPLMYIPDILQYMNVIERPRTIRIIQLVSNFIAVGFAVAGFVHLAENSGDFFCDFCNAQEIDVFNTVYFMIITMTTVGYGDISCKTYIGKSFVILSLISGLAVFATMIPEFANLFGSKGPHAGRYFRVNGRRHVIVCGHITPHSLASFLHDFLHKGRKEVDELDVLIIDRKTPDIEMEALLKRYYTKVQYFVGSIMNVADLQRVHADKATACLIIANKECPDSGSDDSANIMRVISLKNFNNRIRILLQLLRYHNRLNVESIPGWNADNDEIICISELKLGLIGMSCVVPGVATMMTNIFRMSSYNTHTSQRTTQSWPWRDLYHRGARMEMYLEEMPPSFYGKSFAESVLICFKIRVMLLAIEMERTDGNGNTRMVVDVVPCDDCIILRGSRAFIVCISCEDANRFKHYCSICYPVLNDLTESQLKRMRKCSHVKQPDQTQHKRTSIPGESSCSHESEHAIVNMSDADVTRPLISSQVEQIQSSCLPCRSRSRTLQEEHMSSFDSTGMFYFTPSRNIEDAVLDTNSLQEYSDSLPEQHATQERATSLKHPLHFRDHIIVCLYADQSTLTIGLRNFVMPLRASTFRRCELPTIIFVTDLYYIKKEWDMLSTFPDIYILNDSSINPYSLKLISIHDCRQCVIMSTLDRGNLDTYLVDKSSVLCALSIRQLQKERAKLLSDVSLTGKGKARQDMTETKLMCQSRMHTLTALTIDSNVQYIEQGHTDEVDLQFFLTTPFASGTAFADSVLDCLLSCAYYNTNVVNLLRNILVGGIDLQLEEMLAGGKRFVQCKSAEMLKKRKRARMSILAIRDLIHDIDTRSSPVTFSSLFCESLEYHRVIVMGIYRLLEVLLRHDSGSRNSRLVEDQKRIVIYYPPSNYQMDPSDMVYVMQHSHTKDD